MTVDPIQATPALADCLRTQYYGDTCNCGIFFSVTNRCDAAVEVSGHPFDYCSKSDDTPCGSIPS